jgi:hypothetical protein
MSKSVFRPYPPDSTAPYAFFTDLPGELRESGLTIAKIKIKKFN